MTNTVREFRGVRARLSKVWSGLDWPSIAASWIVVGLVLFLGMMAEAVRIDPYFHENETLEAAMVFGMMSGIIGVGICLLLAGILLFVGIFIRRRFL